jgi:prepilin-type N-terminal cleavage/methylation domain-containing protein
MKECRTVRKNKAFTLIELLVVVAIIALLISILLPSLSRARELSKRTMCAANLSGIGKSLFIYSNENDEDFPQAMVRDQNNVYGVMTPDDSGGGGGTGKYKDPGAANNSNQAGTTASMWLIVKGGSTPKQFVCPSSSADDDPMETSGSYSTQDINDFANINYVSYGYHMGQATNLVQNNTSLDARFAIMADANPYLPSGGNSGKTKLSNDGQTEDPNGNSENHANEGQNVLYADSHADWTRDPNVGADDDNIYTYGSTGINGTSGVGSCPTSLGSSISPSTPRRMTDSFIVP